MAIRQTRNVSLTPELDAYIDARVSAGDYNSASEVVRAAVRLLRGQEPLPPVTSPVIQHQAI
ncbi:type II toxin-antitoxin system ParD family antitoxin [Sphingomonas lacusdianchii]|uniref:type II toxin-antitoxin system ParD family antitoxin n=1 Tax=Sphingomonas lacusdianchii TaxID=2917992 RepID=UPI001F56CE2B|nr:type II toxin-antitoxin system ParD family antitoxin [Sphingomonas sp. JXJ CY 53]